MEVYDHRLALAPVRGANGPAREEHWQMPEIAAASEWQVHAANSDCGRRKFPDVPPGRQPFLVDPAWCGRNSVVIVVDGEDAGIVFETFFGEHLKRPHGLPCNGKRGGAKSNHSGTAGILNGVARAPQVFLKFLGPHVVERAMKV